MYKKVISFVIFCLLNTIINAASSPKSVSFNGSISTYTRPVNLDQELVQAIKQQRTFDILYWLHHGANPNFSGHFASWQYEPISAFDFMLRTYPHEEVVRRCLDKYGAQLSPNSDRATDYHPRSMKEYSHRIRRIIAAHRQSTARKETDSRINDISIVPAVTHQKPCHFDPTAE